MVTDEVLQALVMNFARIMIAWTSFQAQRDDSFLLLSMEGAILVALGAHVRGRCDQDCSLEEVEMSKRKCYGDV
jgi:hypothetical protein